MFINISEAGWYLIGSTLLFILLFVLFVIFYWRIKEKQNQVLLREQRAKSDYEEALLNSQLEIQEQTLKNISQEIHDNIGQALSLAKLNLNTMLPVQDEQLQQKIINSKELVSKAISDLRDLSRGLDTDYVKEMGLQRAIEYELELMQKTGTIKTALHIEGQVIRLNKQKELILFRIIQESFHNIIKHAEAANINVSIGYKPDSIELLVADNGKGVDLAPLNEEGNSSFGLGIRNMHSRARLIGAEFNINSTLDDGTKVKIVLPIENTGYENKE